MRTAQNIAILLLTALPIALGFVWGLVWYAFLTGMRFSSEYVDRRTKEMQKAE